MLLYAKMRYNRNMKRARLVFIFGVWIAVLPYLGFPFIWKNVLFTLSGLGLCYFGYILFKEVRKNNPEKNNFDNFSENNNFEKIEDKQI